MSNESLSFLSCKVGVKVYFKSVTRRKERMDEGQTALMSGSMAVPGGWASPLLGKPLSQNWGVCHIGIAQKDSWDHVSSSLWTYACPCEIVPLFQPLLATPKWLNVSRKNHRAELQGFTLGSQFWVAQGHSPLLLYQQVCWLPVSCQLLLFSQNACSTLLTWFISPGEQMICCSTLNHCTHYHASITHCILVGPQGMTVIEWQES